MICPLWGISPEFFVEEGSCPVRPCPTTHCLRTGDPGRRLFRRDGYGPGHPSRSVPRDSGTRPWTPGQGRDGRRVIGRDPRRVTDFTTFLGSQPPTSPGVPTVLGNPPVHKKGFRRAHGSGRSGTDTTVCTRPHSDVDEGDCRHRRTPETGGETV